MAVENSSFYGDRVQLDVFGRAVRAPRKARPAIAASLIPADLERQADVDELAEALNSMRLASNPE